MNRTILQSIVDQAIALDREIAERSERLKKLKTELLKQADHHTEEYTTTEGGGKSWTVQGSNGAIARVTFPSRSLKSEFTAKEILKEGVRKLAGRLFDRLFRPAIVYRPVAEFRKEAVQLLGEVAGRKLIRSCEKDSSARVSFETVQREVEA